MIEKKYLERLNIKPTGYLKKGSSIIVSSKDKKYVIKKNKTPKKELFDYLSSRSFNYYPELIYEDDDIDVFEYIEDSYNKDNSNMIRLTSLLHAKTTTYKNIDIDDYKKIYEDLSIKIEDLTNYYSDLNDIIDQQIYMSPSCYLLVRNISEIYKALDYSKQELDSWYEIIKNETKQRVVVIHNNLEDSHILNRDYLISWDNSRIDSPIYDIYNLYNKTYDKYPFLYTFKEYENRYPLNEEEKILLFIMISIPNKIEFKLNEYENIININNMLDKMYKTDEFLSEYYSNNEQE